MTRWPITCRRVQTPPRSNSDWVTHTSEINFGRAGFVYFSPPKETWSRETWKSCRDARSAGTDGFCCQVPMLPSANAIAGGVGRNGDEITPYRIADLPDRRLRFGLLVMRAGNLERSADSAILGTKFGRTCSSELAS